MDPGLFVPDPLPPSFPQDVVSLIQLWNQLFSKDFFSVREAIGTLCRRDIENINADEIVSQEKFEKNIGKLTKNSMIYFIDDDDSAHPSVFDVAEPYVESGFGCVRWSSISVGTKIESRCVECIFPRMRPWVLYQVQLRPNKLFFLSKIFASRAKILGIVNTLALGPLHTNNYILDASNLSEDSIGGFIDHIDASSRLWRSGLRVKSLEHEWLSVTHKHPASITAFRDMVLAADHNSTIYKLMKHNICQRKGLDFPRQIQWMEPLSQKITRVFSFIEGTE